MSFTKTKRYHAFYAKSPHEHGTGTLCTNATYTPMYTIRNLAIVMDNRFTFSKTSAYLTFPTKTTIQYNTTDLLIC